MACCACELTEAQVDVAVLALGALVVHGGVDGAQDGGGAEAGALASQLDALAARQAVCGKGRAHMLTSDTQAHALSHTCYTLYTWRASCEGAGRASGAVGLV
jgi:hypothetical protein